MHMPKEKHGGFADPILLDKVDKLFACGVGDYVYLPQLVVVGDQSSGKSSVLEGLTRLPFPRDSGLCTRFATQITFRRAEVKSISVSIIPASDATDEHAEAARSWRKSDIQELSPTIFASIMKEVHSIMGLGDENAKGQRGTFSEDILKIDVCGPDEEHFSIVDVPGIFRVKTEGLTTDADKSMVLALVKRYMENPRSIILAVVPSNVDIATQEILTMAEEADKEGHRTIGVLTKPDLVDAGAEGPVMDLISGKKHKLNLGWCVVRNLGQQQLQNGAIDRDALEMGFFHAKAPWNKLEKDKVGIASLRERLQEILASNIRREFPKVKMEINRKLATARKALEKLGRKRESTAEQRQYLTELSVEFQKVAHSALAATYNGTDWFDERKSLRFATLVVNRNELLAERLANHGHTFLFNDLDLPRLIKQKEPRTPEASENEGLEGETISVRETVDPVDLEEIALRYSEICKEPKAGIEAWLTDLYKKSRGFEIGTFDSALLAMSMKKQSSKWEDIALGYIGDMIVLAHNFITDLLELICLDTRVRSGISSVLSEALHAKYRAAIEHVNFLLRVERQEIPTTLNHYFSDSLEKSRRSRIQKILEGRAVDDEMLGEVVRLKDILDVRSMTNVEQIVEAIHDILSSYYKVARKRFVDNLCMQAAGYHLVTGPDAPLRLFSPSFVNNLTDGQLEEIAGEDSLLKRKRGELVREISNLEASKKILG